jgi:hypothetical protein
MYAAGYPNVGGILLLSGLYVLVFALLHSGAFSTSWLQQQTSLSIKHAARFEFAKAMICGGIGIDGLEAFAAARGHVPDNELTNIILLTWLILWVVGVCLFLVRSFAAYLLVPR